MNFNSIFKLADKVNGCFVEIGFGKGLKVIGKKVTR